MNIKTTLLIASFFAIANSSARPLTPNEIFAAIDGEYDHTEDSL